MAHEARGLLQTVDALVQPLDVALLYRVLQEIDRDCGDVQEVVECVRRVGHRGGIERR